MLRGLIAALNRCSADRAYVRLLRVRGAVILMYHSVARARLARWIDPSNHLCPGRFEAQVRFLARRRRVIGMSAMVAGLERGERFAPGTVVITFDDGYRDALTVAAPILHRYGLPATLYLPTRYMEQGLPHWIDRLYTAVRHRRHDRLELRPGEAWDLREPKTLMRAYRAVSEELLGATFDAREELLREIEGQLAPSERTPRLTLRWDEVRRLVAQHPNIEIGAHSRDHLDYTAHPEEVVRKDLAACLEDLRSEAGRAAEHFSFPYGRAGELACGCVREAGLASAVVAGSKSIVGPMADRYRLGRIEPPASGAEFGFMTSGAYPDLPMALLGRA